MWLFDINNFKKTDVLIITYFAETAAGEDWDISDNVGWYQTLQTISTLILSNHLWGENTKTYLGLTQEQTTLLQVGLEDYEKWFVEALEETTTFQNTLWKICCCPSGWQTVPCSSQQLLKLVVNVA